MRGKKLEMDNNNIKDYLVPDEAQAETDCSIYHLYIINMTMTMTGKTRYKPPPLVLN